MNTRKKYLDYTKGFAILLMLFAHTMGSENGLHTWIFSFHMPIFFIVSGILIAELWGKNTHNVTNCFELCVTILLQVLEIAIISVSYTPLGVVFGKKNSRVR